MEPSNKALLIDELPLFNGPLLGILQKRGYAITAIERAQDAIAILRCCTFDLVIVGRGSASFPFHELCSLAKELQPHAQLAILDIRDFQSESCHIAALGAKAVFHRPFSIPSIEETLDKIEQVRPNSSATSPIAFTELPTKLIAKSPAMQKIVQDLMAVATSKAHIFLTGESGTGKEIVAETLHLLSNRKTQPFVKINCAAIPETLIEAEFFGYEKGAFTGAMQQRIGRLEAAHQGTLLLDEITEAPASFQAKLLRAVQEQQFERIGGSPTLSVDVRFISTSNRNLVEAIEKKMLREDLFYRLNVIPVHLPPLRERKEDILPLAEYFLEEACRENRKAPKSFSAQALHALRNYPWPGNIREMQHLLERTALLHEGEVIGEDDLRWQSAMRTSDHITTSLAHVEKKTILEALSQTKNNRTAAARKLGISVRTLRNKLKSYETTHRT